MDLEKLSNIFGAELIKKIYEDGLSPSVQQIGKIGEDTIKALRLMTAPLQLLASYQDRLSKYLNAVYASVPNDNQIPAPPQIAGPIIEKFKYLDENNYLTEVYLSLLQKAINREEVSKAHPAFFSIIENLSTDEVLLLQHLKSGDLVYHINYDVKHENDKPIIKIIERKLTHQGLMIENLSNVDYIDMYLNNLKRLGVIANKTNQDPIYSDPETKRYQIGLIRTDTIYLSTFGKLFIDACIGDKKILM